MAETHVSSYGFSARVLMWRQVLSVTSNDTGAPVKFAYTTLLSTDEYQIA